MFPLTKVDHALINRQTYSRSLQTAQTLGTGLPSNCSFMNDMESIQCQWRQWKIGDAENRTANLICFDNYSLVHCAKRDRGVFSMQETVHGGATVHVEVGADLWAWLVSKVGGCSWNQYYTAQRGRSFLTRPWKIIQTATYCKPVVWLVLAAGADGMETLLVDWNQPYDIVCFTQEPSSLLLSLRPHTW